MRQTILLALLLFLPLAAPSARAAETCTSIADTDCPPPPRVTVGRDLRVEVITRKRKFTFPIPPSEDRPDLDATCPNARCVCDKFVEHLDFKGPIPAFREVNAAERRSAAAMTCTMEDMYVHRTVERFEVTKSVVSTAVHELQYCHGCGGSCHGGTILSAYDAKTGAKLTLRDAIDPGTLEAVRARLVDDFVAANFEESKRDHKRKMLNEELAQRRLLDEGLYVEPGKVFFNLSTFALGCVSGSFHPVVIPPELLTPAFRARINL